MAKVFIPVLNVHSLPQSKVRRDKSIERPASAWNETCWGLKHNTNMSFSNLNPGDEPDDNSRLTVSLINKSISFNISLFFLMGMKY